jgi:hypothetical protein
MEYVVEILRILVPCLMIGGVAYFIVKSFLDHENNKARLQLQNTKSELVVPARMQAYERVILYLERITPDSLLRRTLNVSTSARKLQSDLVATIRSEYEHNMSQQVYMSAAAWALVKTATEETIRLINMSSSKLQATAMATDLAQNILTLTSQIGKFPTQIAIDNIKKEFGQNFMEQRSERSVSKN